VWRLDGECNVDSKVCSANHKPLVMTNQPIRRQRQMLWVYSWCRTSATSRCVRPVSVTVALSELNWNSTGSPDESSTGWRHRALKSTNHRPASSHHARHRPAACLSVSVFMTRTLIHRLVDKRLVMFSITLYCTLLLQCFQRMWLSHHSWMHRRKRISHWSTWAMPPFNWTAKNLAWPKMQP